jgi:hypothetical protein
VKAAYALLILAVALGLASLGLGLAALLRSDPPASSPSVSYDWLAAPEEEPVVAYLDLGDALPCPVIAIRVGEYAFLASDLPDEDVAMPALGRVVMWHRVP